MKTLSTGKQKTKTTNQKTQTKTKSNKQTNIKDPPKPNNNCESHLNGRGELDSLSLSTMPIAVHQAQCIRSPTGEICTPQSYWDSE